MERRNDDIAACRAVAELLRYVSQKSKTIHCLRKEIFLCWKWDLQFVSTEVQRWVMSIFSFVTVWGAVCISSDDSEGSSSCSSLRTALFDALFANIPYWSGYISHLKPSLKKWQVFARETLSSQNPFVTSLQKAMGTGGNFYHPTSLCTSLTKT